MRYCKKMCLFSLFVAILFAGCASTLDLEKVRLSPGASSQILNLRNSGQGNVNTVRGDYVMKNGFLSTGEEYGYYTLNISSHFVERNDLESVMGGAWILYMATIGMVHLLGIPYGSDIYDLSVKMDILDSNRKVIRSYSNSTTMKQVICAYYADATNKAGREYTRMIKNLQQIAARESEYINMVLQAAGPVNKRVTQQLQRDDLPGAIDRSTADLIEQLNLRNFPNPRLAIINISSRDRTQAEFVASELELIFVSKRFFVANSRELDILRRNLQLQLSGEFDDDQILSITKLAVANIAITGDITGSGSMRRLRLRALDAETGQLLAVASEMF